MIRIEQEGRLALDDRRSLSYTTADGDIGDTEVNQIATSKLTVDGKVEHR